jgi:large subunit ribosomal protein L15
MRQHQLTQNTHHPKAKRVGRGISAGQGKTCGRGTKGQKARTGANSNIPRTFEGGPTGLVQRLPKLKGFKSHVVKPIAVSLSALDSVFEENEQISIISLIEKGIINNHEAEIGIKIIGGSKPLTKKLNFNQEDPKLSFAHKLKQ